MKYIVGLPFDFDEFTIEKLDELSDDEKFLIADTNDRAVMYESANGFLQALNGDYVDTENLVWYEIEVKREWENTPNDIYGKFVQIGVESKKGILELMQKHNVKSLNTSVYMHELGFDYVDISVYDRKMDCMFFEPISFISLDEKNEIHIFYNGEDSGECYDVRITDWMNIYSLVFDIFKAVDNNEEELFTEQEE